MKDAIPLVAAMALMLGIVAWNYYHDRRARKTNEQEKESV